MAVDLANLQILRYPHPSLRRRAEEIPRIDQQVRDVAGRMFELMRAAEGVGLAAPQIGLPWRIFVTSAHEDGQPDRVYVNPRLSELSRELVTHDEGCLSLPGITVQIRRPSEVTITALDLDGNEFTLSADELMARAWQHEIDHLDAVLIIDRMNPLDRLAMRKAIKELEAAARL